MSRRESGDRSDRPVWLGPVDDDRVWDHVRIHVQLLKDARLGSTTSTPKRAVVLAVYFGLAAHAELRTGKTRPAALTLGSYAGCTEKTATAATRILAAAGYIKIVPRPGKASAYKLLPPPPLAASDLLVSSVVTTDLADESEGTSSVVTTEEVGRDDLTGSVVTTDEREPLDENQEREDRDAPRTPSPSRTEPEAEDGISVDHRGGQLVAEIAGVLGHPYLVEQLYRPDDAGGRRILGRELTAREAAGWPTVDLVVEVASGITVDTPVTSIVGVLLTRARRLDERPFVATDHSDSPENHPDPLRSIDAYRSGQLDAARRHGEVLAGAGLPPDLLFAELEHRYANQPGDPLGERFQAALRGAGLLDAHGQPTDLLRLLGGAA